jgi:hypothetical protein
MQSFEVEGTIIREIWNDHYRPMGRKGKGSHKHQHKITASLYTLTLLTC